MKNIAKLISAVGFLSLAAFAAPAANAGTWHLNAASCPDLREDRRDRRYNEGRWDRREDRRDQRIIDCPPRSWNYVESRYERRNGAYRGSGARYSTPGIVYTNHRGDFFRQGRNGRLIPIDVVVHYGRPGAYDRPGRGRGYGHGPRGRRHPY